MGGGRKVNKNLSIPVWLALMLMFVLSAGCKVQITTPEGGDVVSASRAYECASGSSCTVEVNDVHFSEEFIAAPSQGWVFMGWKEGQRHLCQGQPERCHLSTMGFDAYDSLGKLLESDEIFYLEPEFIQGTPIDEALAAVEDPYLRACLTYASNGIGPLRYAEELTELSCRGDEHGRAYSIEGIDAFGGLTSLELLVFDASLKPLTSLTKLQSLVLLGRVSDLDYGPLNGLTTLKYLEVGDCAGDLSTLAGLTQLRSLRLDCISDISPLAGLTQLDSLFLRSNNISDISPLAGLTQLKSLDLWGNKISDISPLAGSTKLEYLLLRDNSISDITPLAGLTKLKTLYLGGNQISDIGPLAALPKLQKLSVKGNNISSVVDTLNAMESLVSVDISNNPISCGEIRTLRSRPYSVYWWSSSTQC
jgi:Leucine Rich repeats (2 copies)